MENKTDIMWALEDADDDCQIVCLLGKPDTDVPQAMVLDLKGYEDCGWDAETRRELILIESRGHRMYLSEVEEYIRVLQQAVEIGKARLKSGQKE